MTTTTDTHEPPSAPPPPHVPRPRLERSLDDRYVGGVCGGLGRYFDIDPVIFRVALACLAIFGGAGVFIYVAAWIFIPEAGSQRSILQQRGEGGRGRDIAILAVVAVLALASIDVLFGNRDGGWVFPALVIGAFFWWRHDRPASRISPAQSGVGADHLPGSAPDSPPESSAFWAATATTAPMAAGAAPAGWGTARVRKPRREKSQLGVLTVSALLISVGIATALGNSGAVDVTAQGVLAVALLIVGAGLLVGAWYGRSRGLIALGLVLSLAVSVVSLVDVPMRGRTGDVTWRVTSLDQLRTGYHLRTGNAVLDLTAVEFGGTPQSVSATVGFGQLTVVVPDGVSVHVVGHIGAGRLRLFNGSYHDGFDLDLDDADSASPQLTINTRIGLGELQVRHEAS